MAARKVDRMADRWVAAKAALWAVLTEDCLAAG